MCWNILLLLGNSSPHTAHRVALLSASLCLALLPPLRPLSFTSSGGGVVGVAWAEGVRPFLRLLPFFAALPFSTPVHSHIDHTIVQWMYLLVLLSGTVAKDWPGIYCPTFLSLVPEHLWHDLSSQGWTPCRSRSTFFAVLNKPSFEPPPGNQQ